MEIAIEQDEQTAMEWQERETGEIGSGGADTRVHPYRIAQHFGRADTFGIPLLGDTDTPTRSPGS